MTDERAETAPHRPVRDAVLGAGFPPDFLHGLRRALFPPIVGVASAAEALAGLKTPAEQGPWLDILRQSSDAMDRVLRNFLAYGILCGGGSTRQTEDFFPQSPLEAALAPAAALAKKKGIDFSVAIAQSKRPIRGDLSRIEQLASVMALFAARRTAAGHVAVEADVTESHGAVWLRLSVRDTGPAVPESDLPRLLEPWGTGSGDDLSGALAQALAAFMGGTIAVENHKDGGLAATATLSVAWGDLESPILPLPAVPPPGPRRHVGVLLIQEQGYLQDLIRLTLDRCGYSAALVGRVSDGADALEQSDFELIVLGPAATGGDMAALIQSLRAKMPKRNPLPLIAVTPDPSGEERQRCLAAGADDCLDLSAPEAGWNALLARWDRSVDEEAIKELKKLSEDSYPSFREEFRSQGRANIAAARQACKDKDWKTIKALAHKLKGTAGTFGAVRLHRLCRKFETVPDLEGNDRYPTLVEALAEEFVRVDAILPD